MLDDCGLLVVCCDLLQSNQLWLTQDDFTRRGKTYSRERAKNYFINSFRGQTSIILLWPTQDDCGRQGESFRSEMLIHSRR